MKKGYYVLCEDCGKVIDIAWIVKKAIKDYKVAKRKRKNRS